MQFLCRTPLGILPRTLYITKTRKTPYVKGHSVSLPSNVWLHQITNEFASATVIHCSAPLHRISHKDDKQKKQPCGINCNNLHYWYYNLITHITPVFKRSDGFMPYVRMLHSGAVMSCGQMMWGNSQSDYPMTLLQWHGSDILT